MCFCVSVCVCVFELRGGKKRPLTYRSGLHTKGVFSNNLLLGCFIALRKEFMPHLHSEL